MKKLIWLVLLAGGIVFLVWGANTLDRDKAGFALVFTGAAGTRAICLLAGGFIVSLVGLAGVLRSSGS